MGKRNKTQNNEEGSFKTKKSKVREDCELSIQNNVEVEPKIKKKKRNKGNKVHHANIQVSNDQNETEQLIVDNDKEIAEESISKNKKSKASKEIEIDLLSNDEPEPKKTKKKRSKIPKQDDEATLLISKKEGNKIIFVDDQPQEVPAKSGNTEKVGNKNKLNEDEAEVKDEDIDKFCDEIGDEDNKQYEEWVKLVEAQLHSNKKKA